MPIVNIRVLVISVLMIVGIPASAFAEGKTTAETFANVKPSIAVVANSTGFGTGFCISSTPTTSIYLTNAHVVGSDSHVIVYRQFPRFEKMDGVVLAEGFELDPDLAVIRVNRGGIPPMRLRESTVHEGDAVATAGYPVAQYDFASVTGDRVTPSVHVGTISAIANRGGVIEYDAQTLPGNSGGPLIDPATGDVLGVIRAKLTVATDANIAIGIARVVVPFLRLHSIVYVSAPNATGSTAQPSTQSTSTEAQVLRVLPGANRAVIVYSDAGSTGTDTPQALRASASDFADKFSKQFGVQTTVVNAELRSKEDAIRIGNDNQALIVVAFQASFKYLLYFENQLGLMSKIDLGLGVSIGDSYGVNWFYTKVSKVSNSGRKPFDALTSSFADLSDSAIRALAEKIKINAQNDSGITNFFRYGFPIGNGLKRAFIGVVSNKDGGRVTIVPPYSPAFEAGLQVGDVVISINGTALADKNDEQVNDLLIAAAVGNEDFEIASTDGTRQHIKFEAKDLRWYVERRANGSDNK